MRSGGEGPHRYVLMCLVARGGPGVSVLPTQPPRPGAGLGRAGGPRHDSAPGTSSSRRSSRGPCRHRPAPAPCSSATSIRTPKRAFRLTPPDQAIADAALEGIPTPTGISTRPCWRPCCSRTRSAWTTRRSTTSTASATRSQRRRSAGARGQRRVRRRLLHARHADRAGARDRGQRREHAAEVHVLLSEGSDRPAVHIRSTRRRSPCRWRPGVRCW